VSGVMLNIRVTFYSYFKELAGVANTLEQLPEGGTLGALHGRLIARFPKLSAMERSTLLAVGVDYQTRDYVLKEGDEVSLFPPVQGG
jgi:molybdopterin converting factor small subunit